MNKVSENGFLNVVQFLFENRTEGCTQEAAISSITKGHLEIVKFLHFNYKKTISVEDALPLVLKFNNYNKRIIPIVKWFYLELGEKCDINVIDWSLQYDNLELIKGLYINCKTNHFL